MSKSFSQNAKFSEEKKKQAKGKTQKRNKVSSIIHSRQKLIRKYKNYKFQYLPHAECKTQKNNNNYKEFANQAIINKKKQMNYKIYTFMFAIRLDCNLLFQL